jgi:hypothetical protein
MKKASEEPKQTAKRARKKQSNSGQQQQQCEKEAEEAETGAGASKITSHKVRVTKLQSIRRNVAEKFTKSLRKKRIRAIEVA